jgi:hypothetical protein
MKRDGLRIGVFIRAAGPPSYDRSFPSSFRLREIEACVSLATSGEVGCAFLEVVSTAHRRIVSQRAADRVLFRSFLHPKSLFGALHILGAGNLMLERRWAESFIRTAGRCRALTLKQQKCKQD